MHPVVRYLGSLAPSQQTHPQVRSRPRRYPAPCRSRLFPRPPPDEPSYRPLVVASRSGMPPVCYKCVAGGGIMVKHEFVTTAFDLPGYRVTRNLGIVRGIVVRSRSIVGTIGAGLQTMIGGNISIFTNLCEQTRSDAFELMLQHAGQLGANAVIGARYDATEIMQGVTEVLAYGTAVQVEPLP